MKYIILVISIFIFTGCLNREVEIERVNSNKIAREEKDQNISKIENNTIKEILIDRDNNSTKNEMIDKSQTSKKLEIKDLTTIPQDVNFYLKDLDINETIYTIQNRYKQNYFRVWNSKSPSEDLKSIKWPFNAYRAEKSYGENFQPLKQIFFDEMLLNSNFESFATVNENAITTKECSLRSFPTIKPLLKNPSIAGEGFPFDYLQNSSIHANEPILISHYSLDKEWAYVFSSFASGWIKTDQFAIIEDDISHALQEYDQISITKEDIPIYGDDGEFLFKSKVGMLFPLISENGESYTILTISSYKNSKPLYLESKILKKFATKNILKLNRDNLSVIVGEVSRTNYGWGGIYEQRDCSSMMRDLFTPFGIWLPRNSSQQSKIGKVISLKNLTDEEKIETIKNSAVPFQTLFYKKGHIVLYAGVYNNEIIVFHNVWGIKTKKDNIEGRIVIGKPIFSTLKLGAEQENFDISSEMLRNLKSLNIITR
ncbi:SH3 domain-containing C40 family peptidase [Sulfurimonas sp.]|uniref:SH3 domain-containing C40 family peptidase n=1 Tax=Sulfurimonas sp. TaxID=2022749 RepID=UPI0025E15F27|nr:SH3 domain-containing C40 family peptidase [Sulfurimonas sp.]MDD5156938.1 SH3 domain-containing protein [Sulfurimonas sp.]